MMSLLSIIITLFLTYVSSNNFHYLDFEERIVNGIPISASKYPWMVSWRKISKIISANGTVIYNTGRHNCGASLIKISPPVILTAAHCFSSLILNKTSGLITSFDSSTPITIAFDLNRTIQQHDVQTIDLNVKTQYDTLYVNNPSMIYIHPDYNNSGPNILYGNDIALIIIDDDNQKVDIEIDILPTIPMQLKSSESCCNDGESLTQIGYGTNSTYGRLYTKTLELTVLNYINGIECFDRYKSLVSDPDFSFYIQLFYGEDSAIPNKFICAYRNNTGTCDGDSGSPLFIENNVGEIEIVGVVSIGGLCADIGSLPVLWTSTGHFYDWIQNTIDEITTEVGDGSIMMNRFNFVYGVICLVIICVYIN